MTDRNITKRRGWAIHSTGEGQVLFIPPDDNLDIRLPDRIDPFAESSVQEFPLGTCLSCWGDSERYRYVLAGAAGIEIGALCQAVVPLAGHINEAIDEPSVGDTTIFFVPNTVTTDDLVANELAEGYIYIYDGTGEGAKYRIKSHPAIVGGTGGYLTLYDPIRIAPAAASVATVIHNPYRAIIIHPSPNTAMVVGWTVAALTASYYGWVQTKGPVCALIDGTVVMGMPVRVSEDDDGAVAALDRDEATADQPVVGVAMEIGADAAGGAATYGFVNATLE